MALLTANKEDASLRAPIRRRARAPLTYQLTSVDVDPHYMHSMVACRALDAFQAFMSTLNNDVQSLRYEVYPHIIVCDVDVLMPRWLRLV